MNRARQMLKLALLKGTNISPKPESSSLNKSGDIALIQSCSGDNVKTLALPRDFDENEVFESVVPNETATKCVNELSVIIISNLKRTLAPEMMSDESFYEDSDDSIKDPDFRLPDKSPQSFFFDSDIEEMALQLEQNLASEAGNQLDYNLNPENTSTKESRKVRSQKRNLGQEYTTNTGKNVPAKTMKPLTDCKRKCMDKISPTEQEMIFKQYWELGNYNLKLAFVSGLISIEEKKTTRSKKSGKTPRNRQFTYSYFLNLKGVRTQVCQKCFKLVLDETDRFLKTVIKKKIESPGTMVVKDMRGRTVPPNKISEEKRNEVLNHIKSIPAYESHYTRKQSAQKYFDTNLTLSKLYKLYTEITQSPISITKYAEIFKSLNIKFKKPKLDTCTKCDLLAMRKSSLTGDDLTLVEMEQKQHHEDAVSAFASKKRDIETAKNRQDMEVFTFDLQQCLPTPFLQSSVSFYKRQLYTFNLTVHDCVKGTPHCYMWHEGVANRGGNEIASCVFEHLISESVLSSATEHVIFYSDNCFGQNKNKMVAVMMLMHACDVTNNIRYIDHKFLIPGHTHMECDIDHSIIERKKKKSSFKIHHPRDWYQFVRGVGTKTKFVVTEMSRANFRNFGSIIKNKFIFRKVDEDGNKVNWKNITWLRFSSDAPFNIYYKNSFDEKEPFKTLNIRKRGCNQLNPNCLELLYEGPNKISEAKKQDLLELLPLIDEQFHNFYKRLCTESMPDFHPDLTEEDAFE